MDDRLRSPCDHYNTLMVSVTVEKMSVLFYPANGVTLYVW